MHLRPDSAARSFTATAAAATAVAAGHSGEPATARDCEMTIRELRGTADFAACVALQRDTWGAGYDDVVSPTMLNIVQRVGGILIGAVNERGGLEGFVFGVTGVEDDRLVHWSHMLAVRPDVRGTGIGRRLKEAQRATLRGRRVERIYWTYDPLVARNAHLNLTKLGVQVVEYVRDMYGDSQSPLHLGLGTDRFVVVWHIGDENAAPRTPCALPCGAADAPVANACCDGEQGEHSMMPLPEAPVVRVAVPGDIEQVRARSLELAAAWRRCTRRAFEFYLTKGYRVARFFSTGARGYYVLAAPGAADTS